MTSNGSAQRGRADWGTTLSRDWYDKAACRENAEAEYAFFYAPAKYRNQAIKTFCHEACPVKAECGQFGEESMSEGVWGGVHRTMAEAQQLNNRGSSIRYHERDQARESIAKMYTNGRSLRHIAQEMRCSDRTVRDFLVESGVPIRSSASGR